MNDRKYRHKGYQDSGAPSDRSTPRTPYEPPKQRIDGAPRGRSAGGPGPSVFKCGICGEVRHSIDPATPDTLCGKCGADMHTCWNCRNFDTSTRWECREMIPARVAPKDKRNECTFFSPKIVRDLAADKAGKIETPDDARSAFEKLFKK